MKKWVLIVISCLMLVMVAYHEAQAREAKGASTRKGRAVRTWDFDIEDLVRAESDPQYLKYLEEKANRDKVDIKAVEAHVKQREEYERLQEKQRSDFIQKRDATKVKNENEGLEEYELEQRKWEAANERERARYQAAKEKEHKEFEARRTANLQRGFEPQRFPAAAVDEAKYPSLRIEPPKKNRSR